MLIPLAFLCSALAASPSVPKDVPPEIDGIVAHYRKAVVALAAEDPARRNDFDVVGQVIASEQQAIEAELQTALIADLRTSAAGGFKSKPKLLLAFLDDMETRKDLHDGDRM